MKTFGQNLREARQNKKLTQRQLAEALGAKHNSISNWENDQNSPDTDTIGLICGVLDITPNQLLDKGNDAPTVETGSRPSDDDIKFALFGTTDIDDEVYEDVKRLAKIQKLLREEKKGE